MEESGLESDIKNDDLRVVLTPKDFEDNKELVTDCCKKQSRNTKEITFGTASVFQNFGTQLVQRVGSFDKVFKIARH